MAVSHGKKLQKVWGRTDPNAPMSDIEPEKSDNAPCPTCGDQLQDLLDDQIPPWTFNGLFYCSQPCAWAAAKKVGFS